MAVCVKPNPLRTRRTRGPANILASTKVSSPLQNPHKIWHARLLQNLQFYNSTLSKKIQHDLFQVTDFPFYLA
jgi:hypothetical protein